MSYWDYVRQRVALDAQFVKEYWWFYAVIIGLGIYVSWKKTR